MLSERVLHEGNTRRKCRSKLLFHCFTSAKFWLRKTFFHHWQKFNSKDKVDLDIYFYFLSLFITRSIALLNQWFSYHSLTYIFSFSLSLQIQFTAIFKRSDSQEFLSLEIKKQGRCFLAMATCVFIRTSNLVLIRC